MNPRVSAEFESLFDEYRIKKCPDFAFEWKCVSDSTTIEPAHFIYQGVLHSCSKGMEKMRNYILTLDKLIACPSFDSAEQSVTSTVKNHYLPLNNPLLRVMLKDGKYGFRLVSNGKAQDFTCESKREMVSWFRCFRSVSVQENVKKNYSLHETIGSGSSGTVRIATRIDNEKQEYAIKSIPRSNYINQKQSLVLLLVIGIDLPGKRNTRTPAPEAQECGCLEGSL